jgi:hypothetical protein
VLIVIECADQALIHAKRPGYPIPLVALTSTASIYCVVEFRIYDVYLVRINANDGTLMSLTTASGFEAEQTPTIFLVEPADLERVLGFSNDIVPKLVPISPCCKLRSREVCDWAQDKAIHSDIAEV